MPAKKRSAKKPAKAVKAAAYTISAPNPAYEGFFYERKLRFIDGKARVTDALAKTVQAYDGLSHELYFFEDAEEMTRHFMDMVGQNLDDLARATERTYKVTPPLPTLPFVVDELTPNAGRPRRRRVRNQVVPAEPPPPGVPAGADPDEVFVGAPQRSRSQARKKQEAVA